MSDSNRTPTSTDGPERVSFVGLLAVVLNVADPRERLRRLATAEAGIDELADHLRRAKRAALLEIRATDPRATWADLGEILGVTGQRAEQLSREA